MNSNLVQRLPARLHGFRNSESSLRMRIRSAPAHTGGEFEEHLEGVAALLRDWGCRTELVQAGRYHAVYGNPRGRGAITFDAAEVVAEIGAEAEQLVRLWSVVARTGLEEAARNLKDEPITLELAGGGGKTTVSRRILLDLLHLHAANRLEIAMRSGKDCGNLEPLRPLLPPKAVALIDLHRRAKLGQTSNEN